jgi:hypothetical protein
MSITDRIKDVYDNRAEALAHVEKTIFGGDFVITPIVLDYYILKMYLDGIPIMSITDSIEGVYDNRAEAFAHVEKTIFGYLLRGKQ